MTRAQFRRQQVALVFNQPALEKLHALQIESALTVLKLLKAPPAIVSGGSWDGRRSLASHDGAILTGFCDGQVRA